MPYVIIKGCISCDYFANFDENLIIPLLRLGGIFQSKYVKNHPFNTYAKFAEKTRFVSP